MKKLLAVLAIATLALSCGEKKEEKKDGFEMNRANEASNASSKAQEVPVDLDNKGIGPIKNVTFADEIDTELAAAGEKSFNTVCIACHMAETRGIGPAMKGVYERRSPEWVMNMILNPSEMLDKDPIAIALLEEYNNAIMTPSTLSEEEVRAVAEYLRTL